MDIRVELVDMDNFFGWLGLFSRKVEKFNQQEWYIVATMAYSGYLEEEGSKLKPRISGKRIPNIVPSINELGHVFLEEFGRRFRDWTGYEEKRDPGTMRQLGRHFVTSMSPVIRRAKRKAPVEFGLHRRSIRASAKPVNEVQFRPPGLRGLKRKRS